MTRRHSTYFKRTAARLALLTTGSALLLQCTATPSTPPAAPPPSAAISQSAATPSTTPTVLPAPAGATVQPVGAAELGASWRPGCPVEPGQLRRVRVSHLGFDGQTHRGQLIVHEDLVGQVITIFDELYRLRFALEKMRTVDLYPGAADEFSMEDNNTSAFNCRRIPGTGRWSWHAYGRAIDINPVLNPYIDSTGAFQPKNAEVYLDRNRIDPGLLHNGDPAVLVFTDRGWRWGGAWRTPLDYQHFERP